MQVGTSILGAISQLIQRRPSSLGRLCELVGLCTDLAQIGRKLAQAISELETCRITLFEVAQEVPDEQRPKYDAALAHIAEVYEQALSRAEAGLEKERTTFDKSLGAYTPEAA